MRTTTSAGSPKAPISLPTGSIKRIMAQIELGSRKEAASPEFARSALAEMLLTFLFVFGGVSACMAAEKMGGGEETITGLTAAAIAQAMLVSVMIAVGFDVSAGHLNPAVTIGFAAGGHVTVFRCAVFVAAQLVASAAACVLLKYVAGGLEVPVSALGGGVSATQGVVMEAVLTFSMVLTVYAVVVSPRSGVFSGLAPVLVGLVVGANTLAGGAFSGASMNPARSFGPAVASGNWADHWVYWAGPLIGSFLAGLIYDRLFLSRAHDAAHLLPADDEEG